ncbi:ABC transporter permease [Candidatus Bipolaricaulota sp. J31]
MVKRRRFPIPGLAGGGILLALAALALLAPWISPYPPGERVGRPFEPPSPRHPLGTDDVGKDLLSQLIHGSRTSLLLGTLSAAVALSVGTLVGVLAGYFGGPLDRVLMRTVDVALTVPLLPLAILLAAYIGPRLWGLILILGGLMWARPARVIRAQVLTVRTREYVLAARALGGGSWHILRHHVLPAVLPLCCAQLVLIAPTAILVEASLSFLGLGDPLRESWGTILYYAQARGAMLTGAWAWWVLPPGMLISAAALGFALLGHALEERLNPRLRP